jgi:predicted ABC-type ATPase
MPYLIIISGCNGSGKTTAAPALLHKLLHFDDFVNADAIAHGLCALQPEKVALQAGRIMLNTIHKLASAKANFAFEATLASRAFSTWIPKLKRDGYEFHLIFLWLQNVELAIHRVEERVKTGGHSIPAETIRRRYQAGLKNFFQLYRPLTNSWQFYDNSNADKLSLIATAINSDEVVISNQLIWQKLEETYSEKQT